MTVADNIAFPLRMRGMGRAAVAEAVEAALDLVQLSALGGRLPSQLSGGQRQRVALARAVVFSPPLLLLDEPFGALDKQLRAGMQRELRALNERLGITVIHVTHDQVEAMAISDRIVVMNDSRVEQIGTPREIYYAPASPFVAEFIGESLVLDGMMVRPECVRLLSAGEGAEHCAEGAVVGSSFVGEQTRYEVELTLGRRVVVAVPSRRASAPIPTGHRVRLGWDAVDALVIAREEGEHE
jgi:putative spermidine/putrescine transport system ATP-binding protein